MKRLLKWTASLLFATVVLCGLLVFHSVYLRPLFIDWFFTRTAVQAVFDDPEALSILGVLPTWVGNFDARLTDASPAREDKMERQATENLAILHSYDRAALDPERRLSYDVLEYMLSATTIPPSNLTVVTADRFRDDYPVTQLNGPQIDLPNLMIQVHRVTNEREAEDYVARLRLFPWKFAGVLQTLKERERKGATPPKFAINAVLDQTAKFVQTPAAENVLVTSFRDKLGKVSGDALSPEKRAKLTAAATAAVEKSVYPAFRQLHDYFAGLALKVTGNDGVWHISDGDAYYAWRVKTQTTTDMTPEEIHNFGLSEVARIGDEMDAILKAMGLTEGSVASRVQTLSKDPAQHFSQSEEGRQAIIAGYRQWLDRSDSALKTVFDVHPRAPLEVVPVPDYAPANGAHYNPGAMDGTRPGQFFVNLHNPAGTVKFGMATLAFHEGIPGHHFQIALAQEQKTLPYFRRVLPLPYFNAYIEGWALYSERLGWELGLESDPLDNLGRLQAEMFRATRLVVDTGIHSKHWSREQAIAYMIDQTGLGDSQAASEVERYFVWPAQALAYKIGMRKILELREKAETELGPKFDIKAFHDQILLHGALPLVLLERVIDDWIAAVKAAKETAQVGSTALR